MNSSKWSNAELSILKREWNRGLSRRQICSLLKDYGFDRSEASIDHMVRKIGVQRKFENLVNNKRVGHLDIESNQLNATFGSMISWCIKEDGGKVLCDYLRKEDYAVPNKLQIDKRITESLVEALSQFDVITTYYGEGFDLPFIRSRAIYHGIQFPQYGSIISIDLWKIVRAKLRLHSNRLDVVGEFLGVNSKTKLDPATWVKAVFGDTKAVAEIVEHNKQDVITLEKVYNKIKPYSAGVRRSI